MGVDLFSTKFCTGILKNQVLRMAESGQQEQIYRGFSFCPPVSVDDKVVFTDLETASIKKMGMVADNGDSDLIGNAIDRGQREWRFARFRGYDELQEKDLEKVRKAGTVNEKRDASRIIAKYINMQRHSLFLAKEEMIWKAALGVSMTLNTERGTTTVSFPFSTDHKWNGSSELPSGALWSSLTASDPLLDLYEGMNMFLGTDFEKFKIWLPREQFNNMIYSTAIQNLYKQILSSGGKGDTLSGLDMLDKILQTHLGSIGYAGIEIFSRTWEDRKKLTADVTASSSTTITVDDVTDIVAGDIVVLKSIDEKNVTGNRTEQAKVASVTGYVVTLNTLQDSTWTANQNFKSGDWAFFHHRYLPWNYVMIKGETTLGGRGYEGVDGMDIVSGYDFYGDDEGALDVPGPGKAFTRIIDHRSDKRKYVQIETGESYIVRKRPENTMVLIVA